MQVAVGIDPGGSSGAIAVLELTTGQLIASQTFKTRWWGAQAELLINLSKLAEIAVVTIEEVQGMGAGKNGRRQGISSTFSFGAHFGWAHGIIMGIGVTEDRILCPRPQEWQCQMGCLTGGDKAVSARRASLIFRGESFPAKASDSLLLAEYGRLILLQQSSGESFQSMLSLRLSRD